MTDKLFDYSTHVIDKPDKLSAHNEYSNIVVVDSKDRNKKLFKNSNDYTITFPTIFKNVVEIELISIYYKYSNYDLDIDENQLFINNITKSSELNIKIPVGNYDSTELEEIFSNVFSNLNLDYKIKLNYSKRLDRYYFLINNSDIYSLNFKGESNNNIDNLYSDNRNVSNTNNNLSYKYKNLTNGLYYGFSQDIFTNNLLVKKMTISVNANNGKYDHILTLDIDDTKSYNQLMESLNMFNNELKLSIIDNNVIYDINNTKLEGDLGNTIKFIIHEKKIDLFIKLDINLEETFGSNIINNPSIYTNIIVGDIMRVNQKNKYVLLDIKEIDRLVSINEHVHNSYVKIPVNQNEHQYFDNAKIHCTIKYFNPILPSLDRFTIKIKDRNGKILSDNGLNHTMVFSIKCLNDNKNYI